MLTRSALLYLSDREGLKDFVTRFSFFEKLTTRFVAGEDIEQAVNAIRDLNERGCSASFDHLNESVGSPAETEAEVHEYLDILSYIEESGINSNVSIKLTQFGLEIDPEVAYPDKKDVDANYVRVTQLLLSSGTYHGIATHDPKMIDATIDFAQREGIGKDKFEFQMLYGIRRDLQEQLARDGYNMRVYVPYGKHWYPYFMRRLAERPANIWFMLKNILEG